MVKRGPYGKGIERREQILDAALRTIAERGFFATSVAELAEAVGLSQGGLLHYFGSKEELFVAVLRRRDEADLSAAADRTPEALIEVVRRNAQVPGLIELFTHMQAAAADPRHPAHFYMRERYRIGLEGFSTSLRDMRDAGKLPAHVDPDAAAVTLFALADGLQSRWLIDPSFDMAAHLELCWRNLIR
ncbi:TetR/AcrR family transcriptional regulator [Nocardia sp. NBC_01503]|uniref:TetR/AcrR family transcriptional regulator n=1 Tax=Nocardia sp. NBC_01503 TaxID=2975997 RepID=UPI002E7BE0D0|nr:helix-turn-helix domain-containing protein [Nocardia sp. NBC_01503]WTL33490.1 TetR/AcrR family transcriptional regulator [Nocardia sp. NBC_01503]